jgi:hypothetical protein
MGIVIAELIVFDGSKHFIIVLINGIMMNCIINIKKINCSKDDFIMKSCIK